MFSFLMFVVEACGATPFSAVGGNELEAVLFLKKCVPAASKPGGSRQNSFDNLGGMNVGELFLPVPMAEHEVRVVQSEQVQDGGMVIGG